MADVVSKLVKPCPQPTIVFKAEGKVEGKKAELVFGQENQVGVQNRVRTRWAVRAITEKGHKSEVKFFRTRFFAERYFSKLMKRYNFKCWDGL